MVLGHSLHAVLTQEARGDGITALYWRTRALTGPLFLLLAGWVLVLVMRRTVQQRSLFSSTTLGRLGLLLLIGSVLNWPCGETHLLLSGDRGSWSRLVAFGPLHCVAVASCVALAVLAATRRDSVRAALFGALTVVAAVLASVMAPTTGTFAQLLAGGHSQYPLLPWSGFFFAGCLMPFVVPAVSSPWRRRSLLLGSLFLVAVSGQLDPLEFEPPPLWNFVLRLGLALLVVAFTQFIPEKLSSRVAPLGRMSLWIYAIHLPIVYGFHSVPGLSRLVGRTLQAEEGFAVAVAVLLTSITVAFTARAVLRELWAVAKPLRPATDSSPA